MNVDGTITDEYVSKEAVSGSDVILTIDSKLQAVTEQALADNINKIANHGFSQENNPADAGAAVVLNVKTGEVIAMARLRSIGFRKWNRHKYMELLYKRRHKTIGKQGNICNVFSRFYL